MVNEATISRLYEMKLSAMAASFRTADGRRRDKQAVFR